MKKIAFILLLTVIVCCKKEHTKVTAKEPEYQIIDEAADTTDGKPYVAVMYYTIDRNIGVVNYIQNPEITKAEMKRIDSFLNLAVNRYNFDAEKKYNRYKKEDPDFKSPLDNFTINLRYYKRQYVASYNSIGEKEVWVNCFCETWDTDNWLMFIQDASDGASAFLGLQSIFRKINVPILILMAKLS